MSTYSGSSRSSVRVKRGPVPAAVGQENVRPRHANTPRSERPLGPATKPQQDLQARAKPSMQKESIMSRNRHVRAPTAVDPEDAVTVTVGVVGAKFTCLVEKDWPCESLIASAIAEYHLAFPTCEVPDCTTIFHVDRREAIDPKDPVGQWCRDGDEIELGVKDSLASPSDQTPPADEGLDFHTYDFTVVFHRLPLGFTLKQEMDATVVGMIYPKSAATHYERLVPGTIVMKIGETSLESLGLRQVHEVIRHCQLPLHIHFRGWKKPIERRVSFNMQPDPQHSVPPQVIPAPSSEPLPMRRKSAPAGPPTAPGPSPSVRARASTETPTPVADQVPSSELTSQSPNAPSPYSQTRQKITSQRKKTNSASPYPDHRSVAAERRISKSGRASPAGELSVPLVDELDNQGGSPDSSPTSVADLKMKQKEYHIHGLEQQFAAASIGEASHEADETDSNQNGEESEEMLVEHIKILHSELVKKQEEVKQLASQIDKYQARLATVQHKKGKSVRKQAPPAPAPRSAPVHRASAPSLTLTPDVLEAIEAKQGLPAKGAYAGSNASSVSGYSSYSNRSAIAKRRSQQLSRYVGKTGESSGRCDASVSSCNSAYNRDRSGSIDDGLKSPRRHATQNVSNRYNFMPPKYSANDRYYEAPSSFSTKGGLISRAKITRDSFIKIPDTPGVGAYDVKLPQEKVRGGEIGDSDRSLPWP